MGSIGIISLTITRRNRRFFISADHYPVVKVRHPPKWEAPGADRGRTTASDPLVGGLPTRRTRIRGSMKARAGRAWCRWCLGWTRGLKIDCAGERLVETRRLELLTLSLQRRRSAN